MTVCSDTRTLRTLEVLLTIWHHAISEAAAPAMGYAEQGFVRYTNVLTMYDDSVKRKLKLSAPMRKFI